MENINLIRKIAWEFYNKGKQVSDKGSRFEFDDLFQEAAIAYMEAADSFDPDKGAKLTTYAWWCMKNHLINYCKKMYKTDSPMIYFEDDYKNSFRTSVTGKISNEFLEKRKDRRLAEFGLTTEPEDPLEEIIAEWPEDCQEAARMVFEDPEQFLGETPNYSREGPTPRQRAKNILRNKGWTYARIQETINQMKTVIQTL